MYTEERKERTEAIGSFRLPRYEEIPNVGLYLEQVAKYISEYLEPLGNDPVTGSMISNYVKKKLVSNPIRKQYDREQIAVLIFISVAKKVLRIEDIGLLISLYLGGYPTDTAYNYFCLEFENVLQNVFGLKDHLDQVGDTASKEKTILRTTIIAVAHKVYLDKCFEELHAESE